MITQKRILLVLAISILISCAATAQELMYGQREVQASYNGRSSTPAIVFNGEDYTMFFHWSGKEDKDIGLYMRTIGVDGKPKGPQRQVMPLEIRDPFVSAVWDGSGYIVFSSQYIGVTLHILRVDVNGNVLAYRKVPVENNRQMFRRYFPFVIDDRMFFFFATIEDHTSSGGTSYILSSDSALSEKPALSVLPTGGLQKSTLLGVALDPDKFLLHVGRYKLSFGDYEIQQAALLHMDFEGKLKKKIQPATVSSGGSQPAAVIDSTDLFESAGPMYTGDGYLLFSTSSRFFFGPSSNSSYTNSSVKINDEGEILDGPHNLGNGDRQLNISKPLLLGRYVAMPTDDIVIFETQMMLMGLRGRHITDLSVHEARNVLFFPVAVDAAYSGNNSVIVYVGTKERVSSIFSQVLFSNVITDPPFINPSIVYFQASKGSPFGDDRRLIMWSASSCTNVTLTGSDFEMTNLPPVFHTVIDTGGERTVLRLSITGTDSSTKTRRLVIEP